MRDLEGERNRLVHSLWVAIPDDPSGLLSRIKITAKGKVDLQIAVPPEDLHRVADQMKTVSADVLAFLTVHGRYPS